MPTASSRPRSKDHTQLRIELPTDIAEHYQEIADNAEKSVEEILAERLVTTANYYESVVGRPLFFNNAERQELEQLVAKNVFSTRDALVLVKNALSVRVEGQKINLRPEVLTRLKSRCLRMDWDEFLAQTVVHQLERFVGLR